MEIKNSESGVQSITSYVLDGGNAYAYCGVSFTEYVDVLKNDYHMSPNMRHSEIERYAGALMSMMTEDILRVPTPKGLIEMDAKDGIPMFDRDTGEKQMYAREEVIINHASDLIDAFLGLTSDQAVDSVDSLLCAAIYIIQEPLAAKRPDILLKEAEKLYKLNHVNCAKKLRAPFDEVLEGIKYI
ncbi:MAG: hypothetical protein KAI53_02670 [Candidatus Aenigmarchaeota archaeon]|nr:hypothetical protein [Candidatus Aenigmarchaeota archaeon]